MKPYFPSVAILVLTLVVLNEKYIGIWSWCYAEPPGGNEWAITAGPPFGSCDSHKIQPPINIPNADCSYLLPLEASYVLGPSTLSRKGNSLEVKTNTVGLVRLDQRVYTFEHLHFHSPGEELINGKTYPLVAHLVHSNHYGEQVVIAILFTVGADNPALTQLLSGVPEYEGEERTIWGFNVANLYPNGLDYYIYLGPQDYSSFDRNIQWRVLKTPVDISTAQLNKFKKMFPGLNPKPVPPSINLTAQLSG